MDNDRVLMLGLADAGKTVILYRLALEEVVSVVSTVGFNVETIRMGEKFNAMDVWDLGGQPLFRRLWPHYLESGGVHGLVYVVDGSQPFKEEEKTEFGNMMMTIDLRNVPLLLLVNKKDLPSVRTLAEIAEKLDVDSIEDRLWHIQECSAVTGEGVKEGFMELSRLIKYFRKADQ